MCDASDYAFGAVLS
jgi:hypothetical protein